jgi:SAM-dependent methyltransferase
MGAHAIRRWFRGRQAASVESGAAVVLRSAMDSLSGEYDETMNVESLKTWGDRWDDLLEAAARARPAGSPAAILDLGIGTGTCASRFLAAAAGCRVVGLDHSPRTLRLGRAALRERLPGLHVDWVVGAGEQLPLADQSFDLVIASCCMHFMDLTRALPEVRRVLRPGGGLIVVEPGWQSLLPGIVGVSCRALLARRAEELKLFFMAGRAARWLSPLRAHLAVGWLLTTAEWRDRLEALGFADVGVVRLARGLRPWRPSLLLISATG